MSRKYYKLPVPLVPGNRRVADPKTSEDDESRFARAVGPHPDTRGQHSHAIERSCAEAYRVERYSVPLAAWERVMYCHPLSRAQDHARLLIDGYRLAGISHYTHVRIVAHDGVHVESTRV